MSDNGHHPPKLGDVTIARDGAETWAVFQGDRRIAGGLTKDEMLRVIRGETPVENLADITDYVSERGDGYGI